MNKTKKNKHSIKERVRFSIKAKITLNYVIAFIITSALSTTAIYFLFKKIKVDLTPDAHLTVIVVIAIFQVLQCMILIFISMRISKKAMAQVDIMRKEVEEISVNNLNKRLDISGSKNELKDLAKTFNLMLENIEKSVEVQNQFVSDASHELRTPIAVIQGYANLISRWGKNDKEVLEESIDAIKEESESMKKLIESLLFLSRGDKNTQVIEKEDFELDKLIDEIVKESTMIDDTHTIISKNNEKITINGDKSLIKEAIRIFVDNSIKYTPENGNIKINTFLKNNGVYIVVEDDGIGISKDDLPKMFNRFYRCDKSRNKNSGGTGLGLSIAKYIIEKHNGKIKVYSKLNEGTIISCELNF
jgi:signal transduction histidine kinase